MNSSNLSGTVSDASHREIATVERVYLASVPHGVRLVYYGLVLSVASVVLSVFVGVARVGSPTVLRGLGAAMVIGTVIGIVGKVFCLTVPRAVGAAGLVYAAVAFGLASFAVPVASQYIVVPLLVIGGVQFVAIGGTFCFLLFLRHLANYIHRQDLANLVMKLIILGLGAALFFGLIVGIGIVSNSPVLGLLAMLAFGSLALICIVVYAQLLSGLIKTLKLVAHDLDEADSEATPQAPFAGAIEVPAAATLPSHRSFRHRMPLRVAFLLLLVCAVGTLQLLNPTQGIMAGGAGGFEEWEGKPCPKVVISTLDGKNVDLVDKRGQCVVLNFWATWCPPCLQELPHFEKFAQQAAAKDVYLVGISTEARETVRDFADKQHLTYPLGQINNPPAPFNRITAIPATFVIDRDGIIRKVHVGYCSREDLNSYVAAAQKPR